MWVYLETLEERTLTAPACDGSVTPYIFPRSEFFRSMLSLNLQCILSASFEADKWSSVLSDSLVLLSVLQCSQGECSACEFYFGMHWTRNVRFSLLSFIFLERFLFAVSALFCSLTDWKCLLFAKKWNPSDTWLLNRIHFILLFLFPDHFQISRPTCLPLGNINMFAFVIVFQHGGFPAKIKIYKISMVFFHSVV